MNITFRESKDSRHLPAPSSLMRVRRSASSASASSSRFWIAATSSAWSRLNIHRSPEAVASTFFRSAIAVCRFCVGRPSLMNAGCAESQSSTYSPTTDSKSASVTGSSIFSYAVWTPPHQASRLFVHSSEVCCGFGFDLSGCVVMSGTPGSPLPPLGALPMV